MKKNRKDEAHGSVDQRKVCAAVPESAKRETGTDPGHEARDGMGRGLGTLQRRGRAGTSVGQAPCAGLSAAGAGAAGRGAGGAEEL